MLERLRNYVGPAIDRVGRIAASSGLPPIFWTFLGLAVSVLSALVYARILPGGHQLGGVLILIAGSFDILDGAVARASGKTSGSGAFLDSTVDRVSEIAIYSGIIWGNYVHPLLVLLALSLSLLTSYLRARADSLGVDLKGVGVAERPERLIVLSFFSIFSFVGYGIIIVVVLSGVTVTQRVLAALGKDLRRD